MKGRLKSYQLLEEEAKDLSFMSPQEEGNRMAHLGELFCNEQNFLRLFLFNFFVLARTLGPNSRTSSTLVLWANTCACSKKNQQSFQNYCL